MISVLKNPIIGSEIYKQVIGVEFLTYSSTNKHTWSKSASNISVETIIRIITGTEPVLFS
jgi:hypothetical protein